MGGKLWISILLGLVVLVVLGVAGFWWMSQQPLYRPGTLAQRPDLDPVGQSGDSLEVSPGVFLAHQVAGEGADVVVLHGGPGIPWGQHAPAFQPLSSDYRFHYYHQRGTGDSSRPLPDFGQNQWENIKGLDGSLGIAQQLADVERVRRVLDSDQIVLIGHSYGAFLAALYASEFPERVAKLVLLAPADLVVFPPTRGDLFALIRSRLDASQHAGFDEWLAQYLDFNTLFQLGDDDLLALDRQMADFYEAAAGGFPDSAVSQESMWGPWHARAQYLSMGRRHDYSDALGRITAPTLIVHGADDLQPPTVGQDYQSWIPGAEFATVEGAGHMFQFSHPEELANVLGAFLSN